jgi:hypothetical protein
MVFDLLECCGAFVSILLPTFRSYLQGRRSPKTELFLIYFTDEDGTDTLFRNVGNTATTDVTHPTIMKT